MFEDFPIYIFGRDSITYQPEMVLKTKGKETWSYYSHINQYIF